MFEFDVTKFLPRFLLEDRNGYAMAKAIEAGIRAFNEGLRRGVGCVTDPDAMPEWRLDEVAWEYDIPYDYTADPAVKRDWIRHAYEISRLYGTRQGIERMMEAFVGNAEVSEAYEYGGSAFHFRVSYTGSWDQDRVKWANTALKAAKNVRSVLDSHSFSREIDVPIFAGGALYSYEIGNFDIPYSAEDYYADENGDLLMDEDRILLAPEDE